MRIKTKSFSLGKNKLREKRNRYSPAHIKETTCFRKKASLLKGFEKKKSITMLPHTHLNNVFQHRCIKKTLFSQ